MLLIIDNYDSFTYNLVQYFQSLNQEVVVFKNDQIQIDAIRKSAPQYIVISPGPNSPDESGVSIEVIKEFHGHTPILGICLGHQCIAQAFGGKIIPASEIMHGKTSEITHHYQGLFKGIPNHFQATRYHSLAVDIMSLPNCFSIDAWANNTIMAISHRQFPLFGLQFHPEAILSQFGLQILENFLRYETQTSI
ncbi:anthranilate synthase component II [Legionella pneumophila]|uniref:Anthranilate synthase component II n=1 Tax=Legionella pneumophila subsp. pascullei TaxID=91890 RepID=A0AAX2ITG1_LEGPN|nr:aminodeoxychorismate/anthranilate synthase component II [Legionella pneumophila]AMP90457.1 glutamine amidotransferase [Legionella pneumophila subsp. pascullei]AMP91875.1 anthranilate synthase [Legionella pneumophila subsp. pascullei]AMP94841.1 anthranilate synthase [Legionella pneumophila subsp. pascullei]SQG89695.1 anthranilate synthase component II [Legionella pneumophila subsp. pascullei]VEH05222.1 anthranilate synthase component II [Legionella pneumophila subsp. pascullei]